MSAMPAMSALASLSTLSTLRLVSAVRQALRDLGHATNLGFSAGQDKKSAGAANCLLICSLLPPTLGGKCYGLFVPPTTKKTAAQLDREIYEVLSQSSGGMFGSGPGSGTHSTSHADDAPSVPSASSSTGMSTAHRIATTMRDSFASQGHPTSAIKGYDDETFSFQHIQPQMYKDNRGNIYRSSDEPGARKAADRGKLETIPRKLVSRHFGKSGAMTVTDHSRGARGTHPDEIHAAGGKIREAQPWKAGGRSHATRANGAAILYVDGVGHRIQNGYEIHWIWTARRGGKKIDSGALSGGNIPEFYATWPDKRGEAAIVAQMKKLLRDEWIRGGEFGTLKLSPKVNVTLRKSGSDVPIRGHGSF